MSNINVFIPPIGTSGYYQLLAPYDTVIGLNEEYTLKSIRKISEYLASNDDVQTTIYAEYNNSAAYQADLQNDVTILGLQSARGNWVYVPVNLVKCYPITNGVPYRTVHIVLPLQALPADTDFTDILSQLSEVIKSNLGFDATGVVIETSKTILVSPQKDIDIKSQRALIKEQSVPYVRIKNMADQLDVANRKVYALENYVKSHPQ